MGLKRDWGNREVAREIFEIVLDVRRNIIQGYMVREELDKDKLKGKQE